MDIEGWIKAAQTYLHQYLQTFFGILHIPSVMRVGPGQTLGADVIAFTIISISIGATVGAVVPGRPKLLDLVALHVVVFALWLFFGYIFHVMCRMFGGQGSLIQTMSASLQVLGVVYVVSNLATFLWIAIVATYLPSSFVERYDLKEPVDIYVSFEALLFFVYLPHALTAVHKFSHRRRWIVGTLAAIFGVALAWPVAVMGGC